MNGLAVIKLTDGERSPLVVFDFSDATEKATLSDALTSASMPHGHPVYRIDVVSDLEEEPDVTSVRELAGEYARLIGGQTTGTVSVMAFCSASGLALAVAEELDAANTILVQPTWIDDVEVRRAVDSLFERLESESDAGDMDLSTVESIMAGIQPLIGAMMERQGIPADEHEFIQSVIEGRYVAWLTYLLAARQCEIPVPRTGVHIVTTTDGSHAAAPGWPEGLAALHRLNPLGVELLASPVLAATLVSIVDATA